MSISHSHLITRILASACLLAASTSFAQADRWFRIELLVFSHKSSQSTEQWDATPKLTYPDPARFLIYPDRIAANRKKHPTVSEVDRFGRQTVDAVSKPMSSANASGASAAGPAFVTLPASQQEFRGKAAYMQRSGRYRTLFHEAWVQPVPDKAAALPIIVDQSGDTGQWPLLQGSITIYLSRYLHLKTNLWLNTTGDYLPGVWRMPAPPLGPPSLIIEEPDDVVRVWDSAAAQSANAADGAGPDAGPIYPFRHAVLLQQQRRMRSSEVHYIDNPKLGVVIKITPVTDEELQALR